uniref:Uncharacterized protein n=1 Tax=Anguilla anguilla TaxID=7936 RepID=A0A0E9TUN7_ANGAN
MKTTLLIRIYIPKHTKWDLH